MAKAKRAATKRSAKRTGRKARRRGGEKPPGEYAKEALAEWRKAARLGVAALSGATAGDAAKRAGTGKTKTTPPLMELLAKRKPDGPVGRATEALLTRLSPSTSDAEPKAAEDEDGRREREAPREDEKRDDKRPDGSETYEHEQDAEGRDEPVGEAYTDGSANPDHREAYEEVAR